MRQILYGGIIISLLLMVPNTKGHNPSHCDLWEHVASNSTQSGRGLKMTCHKNTTCTGITCTGIYHYKIPAVASRDVDFCFGFRLNTCDSPVTADIYLQVPEKAVSFVVRTHRSQNIQVPNLSYTLMSHLVTADVFLDVTMGTPANNHVEFGVDVTVRADYTLAETWPEGLKRSLVAMQSLLVNCPRPASAPPSHTPALIMGKCNDPGQTGTAKPGDPDSSRAPTTAPPKTTTTAPPGSGVKCDSTMISSCPPNEMCKNNVCECLPDYVDDSGSCQEYSTTIATTQPSASSKEPSNKTTVIASAVVTSIVGVILLAIIGICVVRWWRSRAQYANRELLLSNDDNMVM